jgi:hypothetical protein
MAVLGYLSEQMFGVVELKQGLEVSRYFPDAFFLIVYTSHDLMFICLISAGAEHVT